MQTELNKEVKVKKEKIESPWTVAFKRLKKNKLALGGLFILLVLVLISILGPMLYPHDHLTIDLVRTNQPPSAQHWLGTDESGRDVLARLMYGGRYSLSIGIVAVGISIIIGTTLGILAGYYGGFVDSLIMRIVDVFMCFPFLSLLIMVSAVRTNQPPSAQHWLGTDESGRDVLARLMYGGRYSLSIGIVAVGISIIIGTTLGILAGYYGGFVDSLIMRIVDVFMCFPFLSLLIMVSAIMSDLKIPPEYRIFVVMFIIGALSWTGTCRMVRGMVLSLREQEFMQAAEALGLSDARKMFLHLLPNTLAVIIVSATLGIGGAILTESSLSFLGLGVTPPTPTWGNMIQTAQDYYTLTNRWWLWIPPGVCIFLTVISINIFGDGLRDALDPKLKV